MQAMTSYFSHSDVVKSLANLMVTEIETNMAVAPRYTQWSAGDVDTAIRVLSKELTVVKNAPALSERDDSVKGEDAVKIAYPSTMTRKAVDVITSASPNVFTLTEAKYLIKFSLKGPFGGPSSFKERVSGKFNEMLNCMVPDGESVTPLRIIVVTEDQLPFSIQHIRTLLDSQYESGSFSDDGNKYEYVLCSSRHLRQMIDNPPRTIKSADYLFFTL